MIDISDVDQLASLKRFETDWMSYAYLKTEKMLMLVVLLLQHLMLCNNFYSVGRLFLISCSVRFIFPNSHPSSLFFSSLFSSSFCFLLIFLLSFLFRLALPLLSLIYAVAFSPFIISDLLHRLLPSPLLPHDNVVEKEMEVAAWEIDRDETSVGGVVEHGGGFLYSGFNQDHRESGKQRGGGLDRLWSYTQLYLPSGSAQIRLPVSENH